MGTVTVNTSRLKEGRHLRDDACLARRGHNPAPRHAERPPADRLARLGRYEVHLDRKLERMLAMLLRLKDLRQGMVAGLIRLAKPQGMGPRGPIPCWGARRGTAASLGLAPA